jgi:hypothetical protein
VHPDRHGVALRVAPHVLDVLDVEIGTVHDAVRDGTRSGSATLHMTRSRSAMAARMRGDHRCHSRQRGNRAVALGEWGIERFAQYVKGAHNTPLHGG